MKANPIDIPTSVHISGQPTQQDTQQKGIVAILLLTLVGSTSFLRWYVTKSS